MIWEGVYPVAVPGCHRPAVGYLSDGRILLTYRSFINKTKRVTAAAVFDEDTAVSASDGSGNVTLYQLDFDGNEHPDTGYTAWTELENGRILLVNYIMDYAPKAFIRGYFFSDDALKQQ